MLIPFFIYKSKISFPNHALCVLQGEAGKPGDKGPAGASGLRVSDPLTPRFTHVASQAASRSLTWVHHVFLTPAPLALSLSLTLSLFFREPLALKATMVQLAPLDPL